MVSITGYGGVGVIGGNKFVLQDEKTKLMFDFGLDFKVANTYLDEFLQPRKLNGINDLVEVGLLPKISGIYRTDFLEHTGAPAETLEYGALFLSHAHADHSSHIHYLRSELPIYATAESLKILQSMEDTASSSMPADFCTFTKSFQMGKTKEGEPKRLTSKDAGIVSNRPLNALKDGVEIGDFKVEHVPVNHSLPGCTAFIIHTPKGDVAYSGDLRFHGYGGHLTENFIKKAKDVKYLMIEGTRIDNDQTKTEEQIKAELSGIIAQTKGLVIANWPLRDTDRLWSFYKAAVENGRLLAISTKQAYLLERLLESCSDVPKLDDKNIRIFLTRRAWGLLGSDRPKSEIKKDYAYTKWEEHYLDHPNMITYKDIQEQYAKLVLRADLFDMTELIDIRPPADSTFISSVVEPFDDEMKISDAKFRAWLKHFGIMGKNQHHTHCSGHAPGCDLKRIISEITPEVVIPIHTQKPGKFRGLAKRCIIPKVMRPIVL